MAEQMIDPEAKRMMTIVAETYERLARRAEVRRAFIRRDWDHGGVPGGGA
jgi:hypothetical protein